MNISNYIDFINTLIANKNRIAIKENINGVFVEHTYNDLVSDINNVACYIKDKGIVNKNIAIVSENSYRWIVVFLGIILSNNTAVPIDKDIPYIELKRMISSLDLVLILVSANYYAFNEIGNECEVICIDDEIEYTNRIGINPTLESYKNNIEAIVCIILTSGTSGYNKAVMLSNKNICANLRAVEKIGLIKNNQGNFVSILPFYHSYELFCDVIPCLLYGHTLIIDNNIRNYIKNLIEYRPNVHLVVPTLLSFISNKINLLKDIDINIVVGGASVDKNVYKNMILNGFKVYIGYGMSEASPLISIKTDFDDDPSTNNIFLTNIKIENFDSYNDEGEILIKGDNVTCGYYGDAESTKNSFDKDGWFKTGDLGYIKDNILHFTGRIKNTIILENGKNVQPEQIEKLIYDKLAYIEDAVVCEMNINKKSCIGVVLYSSAINLLESPEVVIQDIKKINRYLENYQKIIGIALSEEKLPRNKILKIVRKEVQNRLKYYKQFTIM